MNVSKTTALLTRRALVSGSRGRRGSSGTGDGCRVIVGDVGGGGGGGSSSSSSR